ncbi:hypothetical protein NVP1121O_075 [Vibrio phage 1.121.O._10N.286.46.C4]|nr:hypothetical protein NVP1121O_075 [Vibrio phage 1.121.O._10N.286.46.C4]
MSDKFWINKSLEGKTVYCIPTGNNARSFGKYREEEKKGYVEKVLENIKTKYLEVDGAKYKFNHNPTYPNRVSESNSGWIIFLTEKECMEFVEGGKIKKAIMERFNMLGIGSTVTLTYDQLVRIQAILEEN